MKYNILFTMGVSGVLFLWAPQLLAAGGEQGGGSPMDLLAPAVNFLIFAGIIYWLLRDRVKIFFNQKAEQVRTIYQEAQSKEEMALKKLRESEEKLKALPEKIDEIRRETEKRAEGFENEYKDEVTAKIAKLKEGSQAKLRAEEVSLAGELNKELVDLVLVKTKTLFDKEKPLRERATKKLIKGVLQ